MPPRSVQQLAPPAGFAQSAGGLIIPRGDAADTPLETEQWTEAEAKILQRAARVLDRRGLLFILGCRDNRCAENPGIETAVIPGGQALVCQHKKRVILFGR